MIFPKGGIPIDKHWGSGYFTRIWPLVILLFLFNLFLLIIPFTLKDYPFPSLEDAFSEYPDVEIIDQANSALLYSRLVQKGDHTVSLITVEKHFLTDRYRLIDESPVNGNYIMLDSGMSHLLVNFHSVEEINQYQVSTGLPDIPKPAVLWSLVLLVIELVFWYVFHKIRHS